ncbi:unnamed protein product [Mytilus coruscus]|uniref:DZIP3-like HEPN domain-containing protein n=1 Tax=Mytilus coruscus TaxID=42192 RepID=A0A6J8DB22_MYTCO|nr:unnamed protein product [Mytilus coruscus]
MTKEKNNIASLSADVTINMSSLDKNRCAKCSMMVLEVFPMIMQDLMAHTGTQAKTLYTAIMRNAPFRRNLNKSELDMVDTLQTDEYTKIDLSIPPPSRQWGAKPIDIEIGIGEDIERIRRERNSFVHRKKLLDARADIEQLKEKYRFHIGNPEKEIHIFAGKSTNAAIEKIRAEEDIEESYTKLKIIVHEVDDSEEVVKLINSLKQDLNSENINFKGAQKGSIILFIDVKNRVVLDDGLFQSEVSTFIQNLFKFCNLKCYFSTQTYAVIASAAEEFEEPIIYMPEKAIGTCLMGDKGHVVVNFEVKTKIFHSPDSLNKTLNEVFKTIVLKGNGKNLLGKTDVYAELVKSEKEEAYVQSLTPDGKLNMRQKRSVTHEGNTTTEESFTQAQTPVKYNLPVSVNLRQQFNIKKSKKENLSIFSCIKIGNTLVFTDYDNKRLIICNSDGTDIDHIPLSYTPYYMTEVNINTVAVSCHNKTIPIINIATRSVTRTINTSGSCYGISYNDNNLYVVIDQSIIHVMDLTGKVIRTTPLPSGLILDITVDRDRLVCIGYRSIYCCSLEGKLIWKFKKDNFQDLNHVTTDDEGNVYVTHYKTNAVIVVSDDGKHYREILTKSDGLSWPHGIVFDKKENILLVCNRSDGNAFLVDVKKQHI